MLGPTSLQHSLKRMRGCARAKTFLTTACTQLGNACAVPTWLMSAGLG